MARLAIDLLLSLRVTKTSSSRGYYATLEGVVRRAMESGGMMKFISKAARQVVLTAHIVCVATLAWAQPGGQNPHEYSSIFASLPSSTWMGRLTDFPPSHGDDRRVFVVTAATDGTLSCLWYIPQREKTPAKKCSYREGTLDLVTAVDTIVRLKLQPDQSLKGDFLINNGGLFQISLRRQPD